MTEGAAGGAVARGAVAVVVVACDSGPLLLRCVDTVLAAPCVGQLCLYDNASRDGMPQRLARQYAGDPRVRVLFGERNIGFGAAVNRAAADLAAPWLLVLNPDVALPAAALDCLLAAAQSRPDAGLVGALMVDAEGVVDPASRRRDPLLRRALAQLHLWPGAGVDQPAPDSEAAWQTVENVSGAVMLVRRALLERLGGFDTGFFLHFEDLDLCRRVRDAGFEVLLAAAVRVVHDQGSSSHHRPVFVAWHKHRGMWRWFCKHDPLARAWYWRVFVALGIGAHWLLQLPRQVWRARRHRKRPAAPS